MLEDENDELRERITQLEQILFIEPNLPVEFRLTTHEERIISHLYKHNEVSKDSLMVSLYSTRPGADEVEIKIIDVYICKARAKLKKFGIKIDTLWGRGYAMPPPSKAIIKSMIEDRHQKTA